jgi:hypothetical protein
MSEIVQRYSWEDALIEAQAMGVISNGSLLTALKLAHAITWAPKGNKPSALMWKNEQAFETVGLARATYYEWSHELKETGFLTSVNGNLVPLIPESHVETKAAFEVRAEEIKMKHEAIKAEKEAKKAARGSSRRRKSPRSARSESGMQTRKSGLQTSESEMQTGESALQT